MTDGGFWDDDPGRCGDDPFTWEERHPAGHGATRERGEGGSQPRDPGASRPSRGPVGPLPSRRSTRRRSTAGAALLAMLLGFFLGGLLDATTIEREVRGSPLGAKRSVALALLKPMTALSGAVGLDRPAQAVDAALGRSGGEHHTLAQAGSGKPLWPRAITPARPLRLYIAGDSMAQVFGQSLVNLSEETGLVQASLDYHVSTGLSRPDYFDWPQRFIDMLVEKKPDAVVALFGANDAQSVSYKGQVLKVGSMAWRSLYQQRVSQAMDILTQAGRRVYWVGNPIMRDGLYRDRISMMDHIYAAEAKKHRGVTYVSTWALMADDKGSYTESLEGADGAPVLMRNADGIHLTRAGGDRMAGAVLGVIAKDWDFER